MTSAHKTATQDAEKRAIELLAEYKARHCT